MIFSGKSPKNNQLFVLVTQYMAFLSNSFTPCCVGLSTLKDLTSQSFLLQHSVMLSYFFCQIDISQNGHGIILPNLEMMQIYSRTYTLDGPAMTFVHQYMNTLLQLGSLSLCIYCFLVVRFNIASAQGYLYRDNIDEKIPNQWGFTNINVDKLRRLSC